MTSELPFDRVGRILAGEDAGSFVKLIDDFENTGGILVLTSPSADFSIGGDNWVADLAELKRYMRHARWLIEWSA
jgi:hypothetical protein